MRTKDQYDFEGKRVLLSGPMTGKPLFNRDAFYDAEGMLKRAGADYVFSPAYLEGGLAHEQYMAFCVNVLTAHERGYVGGGLYYDAIALLPGWEESEGAKVEKLVAEAIGLDVVELGDAL